MNTLNKICTALTIVFAVSLIVLVAEILYVLYRRRRFNSRDLSSSETSSIYRTNSTTPSKELLYFFCWKNQTTRIEPDRAEAATANAETPPVLQTAPDDAEVDEILKRHALYGPSRVLFTIREEEKEEMEMDLSSAEREDNSKRKRIRKKMIRSVSLEEVSIADTASASAAAAAAAAVVIDVDVDVDVVDTTPFSTPCASPPYFTPSPSPPRETLSNSPH